MPGLAGQPQLTRGHEQGNGGEFANSFIVQKGSEYARDYGGLYGDPG
jgi:hypothetical protein